MKFSCLILFLFTSLPLVWADDLTGNSGKTEPPKPSVVQLDEDRFQIGQVIFNKKFREIRFPTVVNLTEGALEYFVVHENGKVHESLLATKISPTDLNLAFTLLKYRPSQELYPLPNGTGGVSGELTVVAPEVKAAARIQIHVEWDDQGKLKKLPANEWIQHSVRTTSMPAGPWVYSGSDFNSGVYVPESSGDIVAIYLSMASVINYPGADYQNDDVWIPFTERIPPEGTPVTLIISPNTTSKNLPTP